jgi:hypothetical protein
VFFVLKFELILIIGSNNELTEGARKVYRGRRVGQGCCRWFTVLRLVVAVLHYMFRPTWPSSSLYDVLLLKESASLVLLPFLAPTDNKKRQAGKHTHKNQKINEKNTTEKHKWKRAKYNHVQEKATKTAKQIPSEVKHHTHLKMAM